MSDKGCSLSVCYFFCHFLLSNFNLKTPNFVTILSGVALATSGMVFGLCLPSSAAQLWNWSYSGGGSIGGNGTFTTDDGPSPYLITGITGTSEGSTITSLLPVGTEVGNIPTDNLLRENNPQLSQLGVGFTANGINYALYWFSQRYLLHVESLGSSFSPLQFTATLAEPPSTTPEPSSLLSFITLGGLMRLWRCPRS